MKRIGKITVNASDSGLLTARRISRQAIAKVALTSAGDGPEAAGRRRPRRPGLAVVGGHAATSSSDLRSSST